MVLENGGRKLGLASHVLIGLETSESDDIFQEKEKEYDLLVEDEQIAFVMAEKMAGSRTEDQEERNLSEMELKKMSMEETRKSLPIYKYRDRLLEAIEGHQVLIIEGTAKSSLYANTCHTYFNYTCHTCFWELFSLVLSMLLTAEKYISEKIFLLLVA